RGARWMASVPPRPRARQRGGRGKPPPPDPRPPRQHLVTQADHPPTFRGADAGGPGRHIVDDAMPGDGQHRGRQAPSRREICAELLQRGHDRTPDQRTSGDLSLWILTLAEPIAYPPA